MYIYGKSSIHRRLIDDLWITYPLVHVKNIASRKKHNLMGKSTISMDMIASTAL